MQSINAADKSELLRSNAPHLKLMATVAEMQPMPLRPKE
jgi:hypothetical protein